MKRVSAIATSLLCAALLAPSASALEEVTKGITPPNIVDQGTKGPAVWVIGDSLSFDFQQADMHVNVFGSMPWRTRIRAMYGATLSDHWRNETGWRTFSAAGASDAKAVVVHLGVNDIRQIYAKTRPLTWQKDLQKVKDAATWTATAMQGTGKCTVMVGVDERGPWSDPGVAKAYNAHLRYLTTKNSRVRFADYNAMIGSQLQFHAGLYPAGKSMPGEWLPLGGGLAPKTDGVHPRGVTAKFILSIWIRDQVRWHCGI